MCSNVRELMTINSHFSIHKWLKRYRLNEKFFCDATTPKIQSDQCIFDDYIQ